MALLVATAFLVAVRRVSPHRWQYMLAAVVGWLGFTAALGLSGVLTRFDARPPPFAVMLLATLVAGVAVGASKLGGEFAQEIPLWVLVGVQGFRLPLELVMHHAAVEGTMPIEMSYSGYNFDIITGISAIAVALALRSGAPRWLAAAWNVVGSIFLVVVVTVAVAGSPLVRLFGDGAHLNTWVAYFPFVWLPTVLVATGLAGHIVVWRALASGRQRTPREARSMRPA